MSNRSFINQLKELQNSYLLQIIASGDKNRIPNILQKSRLSLEDFAQLISPAGGEFLEPMAQRAQDLTRQRFGKTIQLFAPLYLSNECLNTCSYCGFSLGNQIRRHTLSENEILQEGKSIRDRGIRHLLILTGEAPAVHLAYLEKAVTILRPLFDSLSIEIYPLVEADYRTLIKRGVDGLTLYQETYQQKVYQTVHLAGKKAKFFKRMESVEAGGKAGFRRIGLGNLLGLAPWRKDALALALHARSMTHQFWRSHFTLSFPRITDAEGDFLPSHPVSDRDLSQMIFAFRLFLPDAGLILSTRETSTYRNHMAGLGITMMSAESHTQPGAYAKATDAEEQFSTQDNRSVVEIRQMLLAKGLDPIGKDWDRKFLQTETEHV